MKRLLLTKEKSDINYDNKEGLNMAITVNLRYTGTGGNARAFAEEMMSSGTVDKIRAEKGNLRYEYYVSMEDPETVLLVDSWTDQEAIEAKRRQNQKNVLSGSKRRFYGLKIRCSDKMSAADVVFAVVKVIWSIKNLA